MIGLNIGYNIIFIQQFNLQILNSCNSLFDKMYGIIEDLEGKFLDFKLGKMFLVYILNWNGNFNEVFKICWLVFVMSEVKGKNFYYYVVGNELNLDKFNMFVDFMYLQEGIDCNGIIIGIVGNVGGYNVFNVGYLLVVIKFNYCFFFKWNVFVKGMYEMVFVIKVVDGIEKGNYCIFWGYLVGVEFYLMKINLYFFLIYVGCLYDFIYCVKVLGQENYSIN